MDEHQKKSSRIAFGLFFGTLIIIVTVLDIFSGVFRLSYWGAQVAMITLGVAIIYGFGSLMPNMSAARGVMLAFTVGILTIIPAVLMGLGTIPGLWPQYFYIAFGMAAGIFLAFLFLKLFGGFSSNRETIGKDSE